MAGNLLTLFGCPNSSGVEESLQVPTAKSSSGKLTTCDGFKQVYVFRVADAHSPDSVAAHACMVRDSIEHFG
jgi:hypothetical protein